MSKPESQECYDGQHQSCLEPAYCECMCHGHSPFAEADDHPQGMLISDYEDPDYVIGSEFDKPRTFSMEFTFAQVDPDVLGILTGGVLGNKPEPTFALEVTYPIKRTFWQWLWRKPRQWGHVYVPHARLATEEDESGE